MRVLLAGFVSSGCALKRGQLQKMWPGLTVVGSA